MYACKLQVFFCLLTPIFPIKITVKDQDVQKRQNFLVSWYHVSFIWLTAPSTLLIELTLREKHEDTCTINVLSCDEQPAPPQIKDRVFFVLLEGTGERAQDNAQLPMGRFRTLTAVFVELVLIFLKLLTFNVADVLWYFSPRTCFITGNN